MQKHFTCQMEVIEITSEGLRHAFQSTCKVNKSEGHAEKAHEIYEALLYSCFARNRRLINLTKPYSHSYGQSLGCPFTMLFPFLT